MCSRFSTRLKRGWISRFNPPSSKLGADIDQLGKQAGFQRLAQERDPGGAAGAALVADDALHGLHVPEAPQQEVLLDVDQLLAHVVLGPIRSCILINDLKY